MMPSSTLVLTKDQHEQLHRHLFPGDGLEAAAILLCAQGPGPRRRLLVRSTMLVAHADCIREADFLRWPGMAIENAIDAASADDLCLILLHSHPGGYLAFSQQDNRSDQATIPAIFQALGSLHGTAIMVPSGEMRARIYAADMRARDVELVQVAADDIYLYWADGAFRDRPMAFGAQARSELNRLSVAVIGASGTGSIVIEQAARLGFGRITMVDFDEVETKNLNRILNSRSKDVGVSKVKVLSEAIEAYRGKDVAVTIPTTILNRDAVLAVSQADVILCCVDTKEGRQIADLIASAFLIPLFDVGVSVPTRQAPNGVAILDVYARIDYIRPGGPTLRDRGVYSHASLRAESLKRSAPLQYQQELLDGYIKGVPEEAPSVISLNMRAASDLMLELIARIHPFRHYSNSECARRELRLGAGEEEFFSENTFTLGDNFVLARGLQEPLIGLPSLSEPFAAKLTEPTCSGNL
ncbi:JAB domain-containing protein similar to deubiquitination enzymes [Pseudoduganella lurida]|uniref:JAB domain-containing protein similar to deubiquitination enzymes n=1 Tax=Pseudoduganella lurida TaxID=1036180 RepID=A0A562R5P2_9BURK|nr:ThiF family adenylyltransferase [Pseudoduganella lurida]TWI64377.1 JAB domain-containing protein similar to deubiquitination enzymes [Pseudoduganella lurida]